ncbi:MAG: HD domain-containing protein [Lachnospiraceae bacterium]|nr:HD domain-containing protein [Lachnospiraceae bacterium]
MEKYSQRLDSVYQSMIMYDANDPKRIQHFVKVHSFARLIGHMEQLSDEQLMILEAAAYVHDIGIKQAEHIYGNCSGKYQEELGPEQAEKMLKACGFEAEHIKRVSYLVGHHHTYTNIDGIDYQILVEADFLVNLYEDASPMEAVVHAYKSIFKTEAGKKICRTMFGIEQEVNGGSNEK